MTKLAQSIQRTNERLLGFYLSGLYLAVDPPPPPGIKNKTFEEVGELFGGSKGTSLAGAESIGQLITVIVQILLVVAGSIAVIFLIVGAYKYIVARGNEEEMESAKKTMTSAIVGLVIVVVAFAVISIIINILLEGPAGTGLGGGTPPPP